MCSFSVGPDGVFTERGDHVRITINPDGSCDSPDEIQLIKEALLVDGEPQRRVRFFLCLGCRDIIEAPDGEESSHECDGDKPVSQPDQRPSTTA